jgi:hypothetical protein
MVCVAAHEGIRASSEIVGVGAWASETCQRLWSQGIDNAGRMFSTTTGPCRLYWTMYSSKSTDRAPCANGRVKHWLLSSDRPSHNHKCSDDCIATGQSVLPTSLAWGPNCRRARQAWPKKTHIRRALRNRPKAVGAGRNNQRAQRHLRQIMPKFDASCLQPWRSSAVKSIEAPAAAVQQVVAIHVGWLIPVDAAKQAKPI